MSPKTVKIVNRNNLHPPFQLFSLSSRDNYYSKLSSLLVPRLRFRMLGNNDAMGLYLGHRKSAKVTLVYFLLPGRSRSSKALNFPILRQKRFHTRVRSLKSQTLIKILARLPLKLLLNPSQSLQSLAPRALSRLQLSFAYKDRRSRLEKLLKYSKMVPVLSANKFLDFSTNVLSESGLETHDFHRFPRLKKVFRSSLVSFSAAPFFFLTSSSLVSPWAQSLPMSTTSAFYRGLQNYSVLFQNFKLLTCFSLNSISLFLNHELAYRLMNYSRIYAAGFTLPRIDLYMVKSQVRVRKLRHSIQFKFSTKKLILNLLEPSRKQTVFFLSPGLLIKHFQYRKSLKKHKALRLLMMRFLRKILIVLSLKDLLLVLRGAPVYIEHLLSMLSRPLSHGFNDPLTGEVIDEVRGSRHVIKFTELLCLAFRPFSRQKSRKKGRIKRKIRRKLLQNKWQNDT